MFSSSGHKKWSPTGIIPLRPAFAGLWWDYPPYSDIRPKSNLSLDEGGQSESSSILAFLIG
jgi:hypothetical protein